MPRFLLLAAFTAAFVWPVSARAQQQRTSTEKNDADLASTCRLAAQVLGTGHPHPRYEWAIDMILPCEQSGGAALANVWRAARDDRAELGRLMFTSRAVRDQRVFAATAEVAQDQGRPTRVRLAAMNVLTAHADSTLMVRLEVLENPPPHHVLGRVLDFPITLGAEPLAADTPERIMALFARIAAGDRDPVVQAAARYLHKGLASFLLVEGAPAAPVEVYPGYDSLDLRRDCRFATRVIEADKPAPLRTEAMDILHFCRGSATPALVRLWERNDLFEAEQVKLEFASISILSDSLVRTLLRTAGSPDRPVMVRASALAVLVSMVDPTLTVTAQELVEDRQGGKQFLARRSHAYSQVGRESVTVPVLAELTTLVHRLSADPSPEIRRAAAMIAFGFEAYGIVPGK